MKHFFYRASLVVLALAGASTAIFAEDHGPDPRLTGAPGDQTCAQCHTGTAVNEGGGNVALTVPSGTTYTPGATQKLTVKITDSAARRWGFQLTARLASDLSNGQAGTLAAANTNAQVVCDGTGRVAPCTSAAVVQFAEHNLTGYRAATDTYEVNWTAPAAGAGPVRIYVAANAANGTGNQTGDHIYTTSVELTPAAAGVKPTINSTRGVVNGASFESTISENTWISITGTNLASTTQLWGSADIVNGQLPTTLAGTSVTVNGRAAYVQYVSPTQINALSPADTSTGPVEVRVTSNGQASDPVTVTMQAISPAWFLFDGKYLAATHADSSLLGKSGLFASAPAATTPAKPGETIVLYATGLGATNPAVAAGQVTTVLAPLAATPRVTIGGTAATVSFAGLVPNFARLYQLNVVVPASLANGDHNVQIDVDGTTSTRSDTCCFITVNQ